MFRVFYYWCFDVGLYCWNVECFRDIIVADIVDCFCFFCHSNVFNASIFLCEFSISFKFIHQWIFFRRWENSIYVPIPHGTAYIFTRELSFMFLFLQFAPSFWWTLNNIYENWAESNLLLNKNSNSCASHFRLTLNAITTKAFIISHNKEPKDL
jgi:hypothetical protein